MKKRFNIIRIKKWTYLALALIAIISVSFEYTARAEGEEKPAGNSKVEMTMKQAIEMAISKNLDIKVEKLNPLWKQEDVINEKAQFDPKYYLNSSFDKSVKPTGSSLAGAPTVVNKNFKWDTGFRTDAVTGANMSLDFTNTRAKTNSSFSTLNPSYTSEIKLNVTQPILKNFGIGVNKTNIRLAINNQKVSIQNLKQNVIDTVTNVKEYYWDLVFAIEDKKVKDLSLNRALDFLGRTKKQVEVGTLAPIDIVQSESEVASRQEGVIVAENNIKNADDKLKQIINIVDDQGWDLEIIPTDKPDYNPVPIDAPSAISVAMAKRPDINQAKLSFDNSAISLQYAKNQLLPTLDFVGSFGLNGLSGRKRPSAFGSSSPSAPFERHDNPLGESYEETLKRIGTGNYYSWMVGIQLEIPLGNRAAKSSLSKSTIENEQAQLTLNSTKQKAMVDVRTAIRNVETNIKRIDTTKKARQLAKEKLDAEEKKYEVGMSTAHDVLQFQEDLATSEANELNAIIDYNKSLVELEKSTGTTLESEGIELPEEKML